MKRKARGGMKKLPVHLRWREEKERKLPWVISMFALSGALSLPSPWKAPGICSVTPSWGNLLPLIPHKCIAGNVTLKLCQLLKLTSFQRLAFATVSICYA